MTLAARLKILESKHGQGDTWIPHSPQEFDAWIESIKSREEEPHGPRTPEETERMAELDDWYHKISQRKENGNAEN